MVRYLPIMHYFVTNLFFMKAEIKVVLPNPKSLTCLKAQEYIFQNVLCCLTIWLNYYLFKILQQLIVYFKNHCSAAQRGTGLAYIKHSGAYALISSCACTQMFCPCAESWHMYEREMSSASQMMRMRKFGSAMLRLCSNMLQGIWRLVISISLTYEMLLMTYADQMCLCIIICTKVSI